VVRLPLEAGADVNIEGEESGGTALQQASGLGHEQVVRLLIAAGAVEPRLQR
jgi:ankyrin repeat protein